MFCSSLRRRKVWATVPETLLSLNKPQWQEKLLQTHDICIPLSHRAFQDQTEMFHFILLSSIDLESSNMDGTLSRIQRLHLQGGGRRVGIVFLMQEEDAVIGASASMDAFMSVQMELQGDLNMPLVPLHTISSLATTLFTFQRQFVSARSTPLPENPCLTLLPYCTNSTAIPERALNIVSEICSSIAGLSQIASSADGQRILRDMLPENMAVRGIGGADSVTQAADDIIHFWQQEIISD